MPAGFTWLVVSAVFASSAFLACGEDDSAEPERPPAKHGSASTPLKDLIAEAADQMVREGGANFESRLIATDGSFAMRGRGRALLGLLKTHTFETFEKAPGDKLEGATNEAIYGRGMSYFRRAPERKWLAYRGMPWGPADRVSYLPKVATALRDSGTEHVLGVDTTRIDGVWDAQQLVAEVTRRERPLYREQLRGVRRTRMPMTVWIDEHRRIRQLRIKADLRYLWGYLSGREGVETLRFRSFQAGMHIRYPPPREIRNWAEIAP
jgi:hypothetical protein